MNYAIIFRLLSVILTTLAVSFGLCLAMAFAYNETVGLQPASQGFGISLAIAASLALGCYMVGREGERKLHRKEALAVIGIGWIVSSLIGALPYLLILPECTLADAFFESASGLTTTGASVFTNLERMPRSLMFWRCLSQWIGGLGVVVFFVAILSFLGAGAKLLFSRESSAESAELDSARVQTGVLRIAELYLGLSIVCAITYHFAGMDWYDAICHMFTTVSTAGFSTRSASIAAFESPLIEWVAILFMTLAGTSFIFMLHVLRRDWVEARSHSEVRYYYLILVIACAVITGMLHYHEHMPWGEELVRTASFQVVSLMTTTGYATTDFDLWVSSTHSLLLALMVIGGCSGSTAGGVKVVRVLISWRVCLLHIEKAFRSRVVRNVRLNGRNLDQGAQEQVIVFMALMGFVLLGSTSLVAIMEPTVSFEGVRSAVEACLFNVGPGFHEFGPTRTFGFLNSHTKVFLSMLMIMGRLELYAILVLLMPSLWRRFA